MADDKTKKQPRIRKAPQSFREAAEKEQTKTSRREGKPSRGRKAAGAAASPFKLLGRGLKKVFRPFRFLLRPFKTKPMRFIGRWLGRIFYPRWLRNSFAEIRLVTWPSRRESWKLTFAVFMFAIVFGTVIALVDFGLDKVFKQLILK